MKNICTDMIPRFFYISIVFLAFLTACISDDFPALENPTFIITGNEQAAFNPAPGKQPGRSGSSQPLESGSQISFFSTGGIVAEGLTLTFDGKQWNGLPSDTWITGEKTASVTAYYPVLSNELYQTNGALTDWLFLKKEFTQASQLSLCFSHLFSQISFHLSKELNSQATEINFTPSTSVSSINPHTAQIGFGENIHTLHMQQREDATYTFIVPPAETVSIAVEIKCNDGKTYTTLLPESSFKSGTHYQCNILYNNGNAGIRTAEDFIAFSHLINGLEYNGRDLKEFGVSTDGKTVYHLKNDIRFTDEESARLYPIGFTDSEGAGSVFKDIFDGNNHTLSNITLIPRDKPWFLGIFGTIDYEGEIKNLSLKDITYDLPQKMGRYDGMLCGKNRGIIDNCHADACIIKSCSSEQKIGGLCGLNNGTIVNCSVTNLDATLGSTVGGLVYASNGVVANCYTATCLWPQKGNMGYLSFQLFDSGIVCNSYVYESKKTPTKTVVAIADILSSNNKLQYIYYPEGMTIKGSKYGQVTKVGYYNNVNVSKIHQLLNNWITEQGASQYPNLKFTNWQQGEPLPAIFATTGHNK